MKEIVVEVNRSDLIHLQRILDSAFVIVEAVVSSGDEDESVMADLDEGMKVIKEYLSK